MFDEKDLEIMSILQTEGRISNAEVARRLGMAPSAALARLRRIEERRLVRRYEARLDARALGWGLLAFVFVKTNDRVSASAIEGVQEVHHIAGEDCYLVKVRARDTESLGRTLRSEFGAIPSVASTRTTIVLETIEESADLPLPSRTARRGAPAAASRRGAGRRSRHA